MMNTNEINNFLKYLQLKGVSTNSLKFYKSDVNHFLAWLGKKPLSKSSLREYINQFEFISPKSTINRRLSSLRAFSTFLKNDFASEVTNIKSKSFFGKVTGYRSLQERIINKFQNKPRIQNLFNSIFFSRPKWYQTYHSYPISNYLHLAILILFSGMFGLAIYDNVFKNANPSFAYPTALTRPNRYLSFQGRLTTASGNPITTATNVVFKLYDASSAGTQLWTSGTCSITPDSDGIFSILLGTTTNCPSATEIASGVFSENASVWVGVTVGVDSEATPRVQIATVGYALNSETLQGYPAGTGTSTIPYINSSGTLVLANASPKIQSTSGTFAVEGQALTINTPNSSNGVITINPDGTGTLDLAFEGAAAGGSANGFVNATNANITSGSLYSGTVASSATGYNFINFLSGASPTSKFSVNNAGNTTMAGDLTVTGDDIYMTTNTSGMLLIADGTNFNPTAVSGDITINGSGVTAIGDDKVTEADLKVVDTASDEECLTYETTTGDFEWQSCSAGGMTSFTLAGDAGTPQTISDANTLTVSGGTNGIDTSVGATDTVTLNLDTTEIESTTFGAGSGITWGFDASAGTDTSIAFGDNSQTFTTATGTFSGNLVVQGTTGITFNTGAGGDITFANGEKIDNDTDGTVAITAGVTSLSGDLKLTGADILDTNSNEFLRFTSTASAVDEITIANAAANGTVTLAATGGDTDISLSIDSKGADALNLNGTATGDVNIAGGSGGTGCTVTNSNGNLTCSGTISGTLSGTLPWSEIDNPSTALTLAHGTNATTFGWTPTAALDAFTMNIVNNGGSTTNQNGLVINNAVAGSFTDTATESLLKLQQLDTTAAGTTAVTDALLIDVAANSGMTDAIHITNSAGNLTTGIDITDTAGGTITTGIALSGTMTTGIDAGNTIITNIGNSGTDFDTSGGLTLAGNLVVQGTTGITFNTGAGGDITFANGEKIDNDTNGTILITSPITSLTGDLVVQGGDIDNSAGTSTIFLNSTPSAVDSYHKLYNGSWLVQNAINDGIAALMVDQTKAGDIFTASASAATKFKISNTGVLTLANGETIDNTVNDVVTFGVGGSSEIALSSSALYPSTNDGTALGILTSNQWSDLFLASGAVINYNNDITLTHATDSLTIAGGVTTLTGSADGTDSLVLTAGDILISNGDLDLSGGDFNVILDAADTALIDGDTTDKTADGLFVDIGTLTNGVDGIVSDLNVTGDTASDADTFSALRLIAANNATDQATDDNIYGLTIANLGGTALAGNEYAIYQEGESWDYGLYTQDAIYIDDNATFAPTTGAGFSVSNSTQSGYMASIASSAATQTAAAYGMFINLASFTNDGNFNSFGLVINGPGDLTPGSGVYGGIWIQETASSFITRDITLQNGEFIDNDTDNTIKLTATTTSLTGDLTVTGNDITFGTGQSIDNNTSGNVDINGQLRITMDAGATAVDAICGDASLDGDMAADSVDELISDCSGAPTADYAEIYPTANDVEYGDILTTSDQLVDVKKVEDRDIIENTYQKTSKLTKANKTYQYNIVGIASNNYGDFTSTGHGIVNERDHPMPVALNGRVPVKISNQSDPINVGDPITSSDDAGKGIKATNSGRIVGTALENWNPTNPSEKILVFVNNTYHDPNLALNSSGEFDLDLNTNQVTNNKTGKIVEKIGAFKELIAGKIKSGRVETNIISPITNSDLIVDLQPDNSLPASKLAIKGESDEIVASIDATGKVESNSLEVKNDATVSGTLYADKIESTKLNDIEKLLKDVEANQNILSQSQTWDTNIASQFTDVSSVTLQTTNLFVTSQAAISSLLVSDSLSSKNINSLDTTLSIQSLAQNSVEIMAGRIKIDTSGNTRFEGDVEIAGKLTVDKFVVAGSPTSSPSGEISTNEITSNTIAGKAILTAGNSELKITNSKLKVDSLIYVTPVSSTQNKVLYVKSKDTGTFTVGFNEAIDTDVEFNWWIIELENGSI